VVFLGFSIIAKTAIQKSPAIAINVITLLQPNVYYTCPAGKVAHVKGTVTCRFQGAGNEMRFNIAGDIVARWQPAIPAGGGTATWSDGSLLQISAGTHIPPVNTLRKFDFWLNAGEDFSTSQDSGTNAEFVVNMVVEESPA